MLIVAALLTPPLLLCAVLALGRYEDHMLARSAPARHARPRRHLRLVSGSGAPSPSPAADSAPRAGLPTTGSGHAA
ncbi:MAG TPA: hypothetical protein VE546_14265 [Streptomyces sp.]|uniref:hypothetical protein n=1 Tax=Streptomyces sp. TaxID=1931 RepID=UPI002D713195|nr:hypothetical protein [Streptomyces sp.]HZG04713.1 hypothetical protein [Streptomyces sp.]